jgi:hypothetical protein
LDVHLKTMNIFLGLFVTYIIDKDKDNLAGKFNGSSKNIQFLQISENVIWKLPQIPLAF